MVDPEPLGSSHVDLEVGYFVLGGLGPSSLLLPPEVAAVAVIGQSPGRPEPIASHCRRPSPGPSHCPPLFHTHPPAPPTPNPAATSGGKAHTGCYVFDAPPSVHEAKTEKSKGNALLVFFLGGGGYWKLMSIILTALLQDSG